MVSREVARCQFHKAIITYFGALHNFFWKIGDETPKFNFQYHKFFVCFKHQIGAGNKNFGGLNTKTVPVLTN